MSMNMVENAVWTVPDSEDTHLAPSRALEYEELQNDNNRALEEMQDSIWALLYSAELQWAETDSPSLTTPCFENLQKENAHALNELQQLEKEIEAEKYAGKEDMVQMEFDIGNRFLDKSDHLEAESDFFKACCAFEFDMCEAEVTVNQQERAVEVIVASMENIMNDEKQRSKQWQDDFEVQIGEHVLTAFKSEDILQVEIEEVLKECDHLSARTKELREESRCIQASTHSLEWRAKQLLRGVDALKAKSGQHCTIKDPKKAAQKMLRAKAMVQREAQGFRKARSDRCFAEGCRRSLPRINQTSSQESRHQPALPVLLGRAGFSGWKKDLPLHENLEKDSKKDVCESA